MKTKIFVVSIIIALIVVFLPAASVFAAPVRDGTPVAPMDDKGLESEWSLKNRTLKYENLFFSRVRVVPSDFADKDDLARANELLHKYAAALKQANEISLKHTGFDTKGRVLDVEDADKSIKDVAVYLHIMRALRGTIEEEGLKIRLVK
jgi:hypothetical protein